MTRLCRHCLRHKVSRPRGLCWTCYYKPGVRDLYPATGKFAPKPEPTEEELERMIAEQSQSLPSWWDRASPKEKPSA